MPETEHEQDRRLVERMLAGDREAFEAFGDRYFRALYRFVLSRLHGDRERGAEIVQAAVCKALAKLHTYRGEAALLTWLCACCRNEILMDRRRRRTRRTTGLEEVEERGAARAVAGAGPAGGAEARLLREERRLRVHMVLDALPRHYARALEWKYLERLPVRRIAQRLDLSPKAAESLLARARRAFRRSYDEFLPSPPHGGG